MDTFRRKTPEELLKMISSLGRGRLDILIGAVSGSGKTYHMLFEGLQLKKQGVDVVICAVTTSRRPETVELSLGLERIPSIHWEKNGLERKDLNLPALLQRNPEVVLVDGLAHHNRPGAEFTTRLDDIQYLRQHGISVITTVNVYELEGVRHIASRLTGVEVEESVPSDTLTLADDVRLIDVTPEQLLGRIEKENLLVNQRMDIMTLSNVGVLRELALRLVAEGVNGSLEKHWEENDTVGPNGASERILVAAQYHWNGSIYIRRGQQIARRLNGDLQVVTLVRQEKKLGKEELVFKKAMLKLAAKVGADMEELPFSSHRLLPRKLVDYALQNYTTRMVIGHSRQSKWQELWHGSVIHGLLRMIHQMDIFVVADRTEREGERILPAKTMPALPPPTYRRLGREEIQEQISHIKRGRFKIYIGAAPGVGKTYTMLREGNDLQRSGIRVMIGLLETHGRQETEAQAGALDVVPRRVLDYRGARLEEMDTEAVIALAPEVVLIDELAHTNIPGSRNRKRYEDVLEILHAGISVISTMNVQHLESLNDAVEQITGVVMRETVPDHILRMADEVQLIDVSPRVLRKRLEEGRIYAMYKVPQALSHFFKTGNLIALRELALREIADDVDERLEAWERTSSLRGPWRRQEVICVCVNLSNEAERLIRRGFRIAYRLKASWHAAYVQIGATELSSAARLLLEELQRLTERLGGTFLIYKSRDRRQLPRVLVMEADRRKVTQMIIGQSRLSRAAELWRGSVVNQVLRQARHMDILVAARRT
ncbi:universal stress protein [Paenibacillus sp. JX-17]|uniref:Universal stress protein n=1 Tax=Paenibacillus lacisoli TaxID=3064525 RepID=A0ABT9CG45_9BACL|nr:universal stress protein [Paenibacillus sp. JX-17]MDO7908220.1 universal stress protein [Paenibacillus sp. JX-17]